MSKKGASDVKAVEALSQSVTDWAKYQSLAGESGTAEGGPTQRTYDWRVYLQEETQAARRRDESSKPRKAERAAPTAAPSVFYA